MGALFQGERLASGNWRKIAITLIDPHFGEQTAHACAA
jgi:hypothetical protein